MRVSDIGLVTASLWVDIIWHSCADPRTLRLGIKFGRKRRSNPHHYHVQIKPYRQRSHFQSEANFYAVPLRTLTCYRRNLHVTGKPSIIVRVIWLDSTKL